MGSNPLRAKDVVSLGDTSDLEVEDRSSDGSPPVRSDDCLMSAISGGDEAALGELLERYWSHLVHYVQRLTGSPDEAEDLAQEVFVRVWSAHGRWSEGGSVQGYLYRIARNLVLDRTRRTEVRERSSARIRRMAVPPATPLQDAVCSDLEAAFEDALSELPARRREAFLLVRFQGMSLKAAADVMELTPRTVANHVYLAATDLTEALAPYLS